MTTTARAARTVRSAARSEDFHQGFHPGELAVQRRAGLAAEASRLEGMLAPVELRGGIVGFLADRTFAVLTASDADGRLWTSPLSASAGFLEVTDPRTLTVHATPAPGDPLHDVAPGQEVGMIVIEFATRRRVRINGVLAAVGDSLTVVVEQAYGNCPQYIKGRVLVPRMVDPAGPVRSATTLTDEDVELVTGAETFFIGTRHPSRGADASHRGGPAGFVRIDDGKLWWPDYRGNTMFNTFGNLAVDPHAALLFADWVTGRTLHLTGTATVEWTEVDAPGDDGRTGRRGVFSPDLVVSGRLLPAASATAPTDREATRAR